MTEKMKSKQTDEVLRHFDIDMSELREYLRDKEEWKRKQAAAIPQWIPVTERLPKVGEEVLVYAVGRTDDFSSTITITDRMIFRMFPSSEGVETWSSPWQYFMTNYEITHWMPLPEPPKEETVNEITPEMIEAAKRNEKQIKERVDRIYDELIAEKRAEIERLEAEIAKMPPLDYEKLVANPPKYSDSKEEPHD